GFSAELTPAQVAEVRADPRVETVVPDARVHATGNQLSPPWGLDRIDQRSLPLDRGYGYLQTGAGVTAFVIDTGIRATHTQFGGRVSGGRDFVDDDANANDCAGHGTHVAGLIGGRTFGVAKGIALVPVRVLDCFGDGYTSDVIAGVDWVVQHKPAGPSLINLSLGGGVSSQLDAAVSAATDAGITVVVAAGNEDADACLVSPARTPSAITVAASDRHDQRAFFSNYGRCVDLFAPGLDITSAYATSDTATLVESGTSMAAPHVAGIVARMLQTSPGLTPAEVTAQLRSTATTGRITDRMGSPDLLAYVAGPPRRSPAAPTAARAAASNKTASATISWTAPADPGTSPVTAYKITRDGTDNQLRGATTITVPASRRSAVLTGLRGNRTYRLTVRAVSPVGAGPVATSTVTMATVPLSAPTATKVGATSYRKRTAKLTWSVPTDTGGRKITAYRVYRSGKSTSGKGPYAKTLSAKKRSFTFTKLKRNTTYTLQVRAKTGKTYGPKTSVTVKLT
ncbi:MAG TPA: S8 family serine peptidase, partial [Microlunatus sp.]|nr:S8 family serine peptidase [Microlunatus sp.]